MDYHKGKRPDTRNCELIDVGGLNRLPKLSEPCPYFEERKVPEDEDKFNKDLNKLLMKYGFDRVYNVLRDEHYRREYCKNEPRLTLEQLMGNIETKKKAIKEPCDPLEGDHIGINSEYFEPEE